MPPEPPVTIASLFFVSTLRPSFLLVVALGVHTLTSLVLDISTDGLPRTSYAPLHLIDSFTDVGDLVVDPFCGGGTVPAAAVRRARRCIAAELDEEYYRRAVKRVEKERSPHVALGPPRPVFVPPPRLPSRENQQEFAEIVRERLEEFDMNVIVLRPYQLAS